MIIMLLLCPINTKNEVEGIINESPSQITSLKIESLEPRMETNIPHEQTKQPDNLIIEQEKMPYKSTRILVNTKLMMMFLMTIQAKRRTLHG